MKKTLLMAAAALAATVISSQAGVYSQNIVGYVNVNCPQGFTPLSTPFDSTDLNGNVDNATNIFQNPYNAGIGNGPYDASELVVWTGTKYKIFLFDANPADAAALSQTFTGITDQGGNFVTPPVLTNGVGYYLSYSQIAGYAATNVLTYVGTVRGSVASGLSNTVVLASAPLVSFTASGLPVGGGLLTGLQLTNLLAQGVLDGDEVQVPKINSHGVAQGYTIYLFDSQVADATALGQAFTGITDQGGNFLPEPIIPVGGSFFFLNENGATLNWTQQLTF